MILKNGILEREFLKVWPVMQAMYQSQTQPKLNPKNVQQRASRRLKETIQEEDAKILSLEQLEKIKTAAIEENNSLAEYFKNNVVPEDRLLDAKALNEPLIQALKKTYKNAEDESTKQLIMGLFTAYMVSPPNVRLVSATTDKENDIIDLTSKLLDWYLH